MSWNGSLVMMSLGGSPDMVSWLSLDIVTVSADRILLNGDNGA